MDSDNKKNQVQLSTSDEWEIMYRKFVAFKADNPNAMPSYEKDDMLPNPLYTWCSVQRMLKKQLPPEQVERLTNAGFNWKTSEVTPLWEQRYREFLEFRSNNHEGMPKDRTNGFRNPLAGWCYKQITNKHKLTFEQIAKLDAAGFEWKVKDIEAAWEKNYLDFLEFRKNNPVGMPVSWLGEKANPLHSWCIIQRDRKFKLTPERLSKLNAAGFDWDIFNDDDAWEVKFNEFVEFKKMNPDGMPPTEEHDKQKRALHQWCAKQRRMQFVLPEKRKKRLDEAGFIWDYKNYKSLWEEHLDEFATFTKNNPEKALSESSSNAREVFLAKWCDRQKLEKSKLTERQIQMLTDAGFNWYVDKEAQKQHWEKWFKEYLNFRKSSPDGMPPIRVNGKYNPVYAWVRKQCAERQWLTKKQIARLDAAGFVWQTKNRLEYFDKMFNEYLEYRKNNPDRIKPKSKSGTDKLYEWCRSTRNNKAKLMPEQIKKLDDAGFPWKAKNADEAWEQHYQEYLEFRKIKPEGMPDGYLNGKANPLHNWCRLQQRAKRKLSPEKIKKLDDAKFTWFKRKMDWQDNYKIFLNFRAQHEKGMPQQFPDWRKKNIVPWCIEQIKNKHLLMPEFIQKLDEAGFEWE